MRYFFLVIFALLLLKSTNMQNLNTLDLKFPPGFVFGTSTAAYQVEGGWLEGGKGFSIWDAFSHIPGTIANGDKGDEACDHYHRFKEDFKLMASLGLKHYRFSISWTRIFPTGYGPDANPAGVQYYNDLINSLLENGITPYVTLYHNDMPLGLSMYPNPSNAFLRSDFPSLFQTYAREAFKQFGDRVKFWFTFNEPWCFACLGTYGGEDPYQISHNALLAHGLAVDAYRKEFQSNQGGKIGIVLNLDYYYPKDPTNPEHIMSCERAHIYKMKWYMDPLMFGDYPELMKTELGSRLPKFSNEETKLLAGSIDFLAINYYMSYLSSPPETPFPGPSYLADENVSNVFDPTWPTTYTEWGVHAPGIKDLLLYIKKVYGNLPLYITENGCALKEESTEIAVNDTFRTQFIMDHISNVSKAIEEGAHVNGYFVWSFMDNLEWNSGYSKRFGMIRVEHPSMERIVKNSMRWYSEFIRKQEEKWREEKSNSSFFAKINV